MKLPNCEHNIDMDMYESFEIVSLCLEFNDSNDLISWKIKWPKEEIFGYNRVVAIVRGKVLLDDGKLYKVFNKKYRKGINQDLLMETIGRKLMKADEAIYCFTYNSVIYGLKTSNKAISTFDDYDVIAHHLNTSTPRYICRILSDDNKYELA